MNERTKELKSNALADYLEAKLESGSQLIKPILIGGVVLFILILTVMAIRSRSEANLAAASSSVQVCTLAVRPGNWSTMDCITCSTTPPTAPPS